MGLESLDFGAGDAHHTLPRAGHNAHVDDLPGLLRILTETHARDWRWNGASG